MGKCATDGYSSRSDGLIKRDEVAIGNAELDDITGMEIAKDDGFVPCGVDGVETDGCLMRFLRAGYGEGDVWVGCSTAEIDRREVARAHDAYLGSRV